MQAMPISTISITGDRNVVADHVHFLIFQNAPAEKSYTTTLLGAILCAVVGYLLASQQPPASKFYAPAEVQVQQCVSHTKEST